MTAIITGGTRGLGKSIALEFAKNNYDLVLNYINNEENANKVKKYIEDNYKVKVLLYKGDISIEKNAKQLLEVSLKTFNSIDVLVNNAGIAIDTILDYKTVDNFKKILDTNLIGPFLMCKYIGNYMFQEKKGKIINISSSNSINTYYPESMDYDASKAGLNILTKNFAKLYAPYINVNAIASGWIETEMNKEMDLEYKKLEEEKILLNRFAEPFEIANVVYFLATDKANYINGSILEVNGGIK